MQWWLTVFFLIGGGWVAGDRLDGWASRAYATREECQIRLRFAEEQTARYPLGHETRWMCNPGQPSHDPPPALLEAGWQNRPWPVLAHWYDPPAVPGLEIFTHERLKWIAEDGIGLRYSGPLAAPLADELRKLLLAKPQRFNHAVLELDSAGGELGYVKELSLVLREIALRMDLTTRVMEGSLCASGCIPLFMQGKVRKASGASIWVFHGARGAFTNIPDPAATDEYLALLTDAGMDAGFLSFLTADKRIYRPGSLILSGYEIFHVHKAGIVTELLPSWREEEPILPSGLIPR